MYALLSVADLPVLDERHAFVQVDLPIEQEGNHRVIGARIHEGDTSDSSPYSQHLHVARTEGAFAVVNDVTDAIHQFRT